LNVTAQEFDQMATTPPMEWNSWEWFGMGVTKEKVKSSVDYMAKYMKSTRWTYIVVDIVYCYGVGLNTSNFNFRDPPQYIDEYGRLISAIRKFPSVV